MQLPSLNKIKFFIKHGFMFLFTKSEGLDTIIEVDGILTRAGKQLTQPEKDRLHNDAVMFSNSLLYRLCTETTPLEIQRMLIEEAKTEEEYIYYRAILADRQMIVNLVSRCLTKNI